MASLLRLLQLAVLQSIGPQRAQRTPEPHGTMEEEAQVKDYDRADESKLYLSYVAVLWYIHRQRGPWHGGKALDVCCGPGQFSKALAKYFPFDLVVGIDLSAPMLAAAQRRADHRVRFLRANALELHRVFPESSFQLITCNNALHHLEDLAAVGQLLKTLDRLAAPDGWIVASDLVRLRTPELNDRYVDVLAHDYEERGLAQLKADFRASMHAAWIPEELLEALPGDAVHQWEILVPRFLPTLQLIVGRPRQQPSKPPEPPGPEPAATGLEWHLLKFSLLTARRLSRR